jgi:predicted alpha/beta-fold hydrolase
MRDYAAPWWLPGGNLQTIWAAKLSRRHDPATLPAQQAGALRWRRERWDTPDGDFIDVDFAEHPAAASAPWVVLFHGLEGSSESHSSQAMAVEAGRRGLPFCVPHFRGCSGELNLGPRAYHSGDHEEVGWILQRLRARAPGPLWAMGVSLGGNALLRWAQEAGTTASSVVRAVAAVSSPIDLAAGGHAIGQGFNRWVYTRMFLASMKPKALQKLQQHPGLFDGQALQRARTLYEFDQIFTAPLHGFSSTEDYWRRASAKPGLRNIRVPALVLNALNDPFVPAASLPTPDQVGDWVTLWQPAHGGHVGFPAGAWPGHVQTVPQQLLSWMAAL